jgi:RNA polymerase sigma-70 factor (ECF subfamily)
MPSKYSRAEEVILPHLDAAYNLARWLMRSDADANDAVQDACVRALRFFGSFRGGDGRVWLLTIVRNTCYSKLKRNRLQEQQTTTFDDELHGREIEASSLDIALIQSLDAAMVQRAVEALPEEFREAIVMRELEGLSYKEIAEVTEVPIGTVMSRLARARARLQRALTMKRTE